MEFTPKTGLKGLIENLQGDIIAAISVSLIALPLSLGIALAAGAPAMAGSCLLLLVGLLQRFTEEGTFLLMVPQRGLLL